jgi:DNA-binding MarR family transcriptional regulator
MDRDGALNLLDGCLERIRRVQSSRRTVRLQSERSGVALSPLSVTLLATLDRDGPDRVQALADRTGTVLARVSRELRVLVESGHVRMRSDRADKRARIVELTPFGRRQFAAHRGAARTMIDELVADWDDADVLAFADLFDRFLRELPAGAAPIGPIDG